MIETNLLGRRAARPTSESRNRYRRLHKVNARKPCRPNSIRSREECRSFVGDGEARRRPRK
jgi:hypothetical protein